MHCFFVNSLRTLLARIRSLLLRYTHLVAVLPAPHWLGGGGGGGGETPATQLAAATQDPQNLLHFASSVGGGGEGRGGGGGGGGRGGQGGGVEQVEQGAQEQVGVGESVGEVYVKAEVKVEAAYVDDPYACLFSDDDVDL